MRFLIGSAVKAALAAGFVLAICAGTTHSAQARDHFSFSIGNYGPGGGFSLGYRNGGGRRGHFHGGYSFNWYIPPAYPYYFAPRPYYYQPQPYYAPRPYYGSYAPAPALDLFPPYDRSSLSVRQRAAADAARRQALEAPVGDSITWNTGNASGTVTTTRDGWAGERYCREYRQDVTIEGRTQETYATACQTEGGDWQLVANQ